MKALVRTAITALVAAGIVSAGTAAPAQEKISIAMAMPDVSTAFWVSLAYGVQDQAKKRGVDLTLVDAGGFTNTSTQIQQLQTLMQRHFNVIMIGATNAAALGPVVDQVIASGTPVIGVSSLPSSEKLAGTIGADHYGMGAFDAKCLAESLNGKGDVAVMGGPPGVGWAEQRDAGFVDTLKKSYPNLRIVATQYGPSQRNAGLTLMEDWLQRFPDLKGVFGVTDDLGAGAADAISAAGKTGTIQIATANLSQIGRAYVEQKKIACEAAQQVVVQGRAAVDMAIDIAQHKPFAKAVKTKAIGVTRTTLPSLNYGEIDAPANYKPL